MRFSKFSGFEKTIILVALVLSAAVGVASFAYTSAKDQTSAAPDIKEYQAVNTNKLSGALAGSRDEIPSGEIEITDNTSKVVLRVDGMSCSGCIYTIKSSLAGFKGIQDILVNIPAGEAEVLYNAEQLKDVGKLADAITASGYPAKVTAVLSSDQIRKERSLASARSLNYIASVGEWDISRNDFDMELKHAQSRYAAIYGDGIFTGDQGKALMDNLKTQIVSRLINEGIQIQEIRRSGYALNTGQADAEFRKYLTQKGIDLEKFKTDLEKNGYAFDYYMKKFENRVLINAYLNDRVLDGIADDFEKQRRYTSWFKNARLLAKTVYYDKEIERLIQAQAGGGGCSGGSSCSGSS